jgi:hypothetical protein
MDWGDWSSPQIEIFVRMNNVFITLGLLALLTVGCAKKGGEAALQKADDDAEVGTLQGLATQLNWEEMRKLNDALEAMGARVNWEEQEQGDPELEVEFAGQPITDADLPGIAHVLQQNPRFQFLDLTRTKVTDQGLKHLQGLANLRTLLLSHVAVTDAGVEELKKLKQLEYLELNGTKMTAAGLKALKQALPNCHFGREKS